MSPRPRKPAGDTGGITADPTPPELAENLDLDDLVDEPEAEAADESEPLVKARWVGQPVWNPEQGVIGYGDPIKVTAEQLADEGTTAVAWADDWSPDPEPAALSAAALGPTDEPEEG